MAKNHCKFPERKNEKAPEPDTAYNSLVVDKDALGEEVPKNVANNVLREICENNKKVEKEMSSYLDCEHKVETKDPTRSKYNMATMTMYLQVLQKSKIQFKYYLRAVQDF